jgi:D-aspartate ligase
VPKTLTFPKARLRAAVDSGPVPIIAMGSGLTLNGVIRILGQARLPVYCVCPSDDFVLHSRWYREPPLHGAENLKPFELETFLRSLDWEEAVLMPCSDDWVRATISLPTVLARRFHASVPVRDVVESMLDKWKFAELLTVTDTPHPETMLLESCDHVRNLSERYFGDRIFKPESSVEFAAKHGVKGYLVHSRAEALEIAQKVEYPIMLQEYIPGPPTQSYFVDGFVDRNGRVCARFARQRIRMHPPYLGNSSLTVSISLEQVRDAVVSLDELLAHVNYRGIFSAEFKLDFRDGLFKLLEVNARPWWYIEFAARCGVDVCSMAYADALGLFVQPIKDYKIRRSCTFLPYDIHAYRAEHRENGFHFWQWIESCAGADDALFSSRDIGPGLAFTRDIGKIAMRRASRVTAA